MKKKRIRHIPFHFMVSEKELEQIKERMTEAGIINRSEFVRRMTIKGYVINIDISFVRELISLQRRCVNNLKQIAAHTNAHGIYADEISALQKGYDELWGMVSDIIKYLAEIMLL